MNYVKLTFYSHSLHVDSALEYICGFIVLHVDSALEYILVVETSKLNVFKLSEFFKKKNIQHQLQVIFHQFLHKKYI